MSIGGIVEMWPVVAGGYGICLSLLFVISNLFRMGISVRIRFGVLDSAFLSDRLSQLFLLVPLSSAS